MLKKERGMKGDHDIKLYDPAKYKLEFMQQYKQFKTEFQESESVRKQSEQLRKDM